MTVWWWHFRTNVKRSLPKCRTSPIGNPHPRSSPSTQNWPFSRRGILFFITLTRWRAARLFITYYNVNAHVMIIQIGILLKFSLWVFWAKVGQTCFNELQNILYTIHIKHFIWLKYFIHTNSKQNIVFIMILIKILTLNAYKTKKKKSWLQITIAVTRSK